MTHSSDGKKGFTHFCAAAGTAGHDVLRILGGMRSVVSLPIAWGEWNDGVLKGEVQVVVKGAYGTEPMKEAVEIFLCEKEGQSDLLHTLILVEDPKAPATVTGLVRRGDGAWILPVRKMESPEGLLAYGTQLILTMIVNPARKRLVRSVPAEKRASRRVPVGTHSSGPRFEDWYQGLFTLSLGAGGKGEVIDLYVKEGANAIRCIESFLGESPNWGDQTDGGSEMACSVPFTVHGRRISLKIHLGEFADLSADARCLEDVGTGCVLRNLGEPFYIEHPGDFTRSEMHAILERVLGDGSARLGDSFEAVSEENPVGGAEEGGTILLG